MAEAAVSIDGEKALENTCGPMREAIQAVLDRNKKEAEDNADQP